MFPAGESVVRMRGTPATDPYSGESGLLDWSDPDEDTYQCGVAIGSTAEPAEVGREAVVSDFTVYAPADADIAPRDRLLIREKVCEVAGIPFSWVNPFTGTPFGVVVNANIVEG